MTRLISWNVNGIRSAAKQGLLKWLSYESPDVLCLQEIKCVLSDLEDVLITPFGYTSYWAPAEKKGYSGVCIYSKTEPLSVQVGIGADKFDGEGRTIIAEFPGYVLINGYFPNSRRDHSRLEYKLEYCEAVAKVCKRYKRQGKNIVICGDVNIAHTEIDLRNPKTNVDNAGFLPEERSWLTGFLKSGYVDTFRAFTKDAGHYTWWSARPGVREKNIGWRLDYFFVNDEFRNKLKAAKIHPDVYGSDHCPVSIEISV